MFFIELLTVTFLIVLVSAILMVRYGYAPSPFLGQYMSDENDLNRSNDIIQTSGNEDDPLKEISPESQSKEVLSVLSALKEMDARSLQEIKAYILNFNRSSSGMIAE